jgi:hypothetical protein
MSAKNVLALGQHRFPVSHATFRRITDDGQGQPGWEFNIRTGPPLEEPDESTEAFLFHDGVRF